MQVRSWVILCSHKVWGLFVVKLHVMYAGGICNAGMPTNSVRSQYVWVVNMAASMGMYVTVDFHSNASGDRTFYNVQVTPTTWPRPQ